MTRGSAEVVPLFTPQNIDVDILKTLGLLQLFWMVAMAMESSYEIKRSK